MDRPEAAREALRLAGWQAAHGNGARNGDHTLRVAANGEADAALLLKQLVLAGHNVYHAALAQPSLEDIFLQLTAAPEAPAPLMEPALAAAGGME